MIKARHAKGEVTEPEMAELQGRIALAVDSIIVGALKDEELAQALAPTLREETEGEPRVWALHHDADAGA